MTTSPINAKSDLPDHAFVELCSAQKGLWMAQQLDPDNPLFNTGQFIELKGPLDLQQFEAAHAQTMNEAQALRLQITLQDGGPVQSLRAAAPQLEFVDVSEQPEPFEAARTIMETDQSTAIDPACDPLAKFILLRLTATHHLWYERIHHLAIDGFAMVLITNRVGDVYSESMRAQTLKPKPALMPLSAALEADHVYLTSEKYAQDKSFWQEACADLSAPASPNPNAASARSAHQFHRIQAELPPDTVELLMARAKALKLAWPDVLTALSAAYLRRVSPDGAAVFGLPFSARFGTKAARVPCMWMNVLPHELGLDETVPLDEALRAEGLRLIAGRKAGRYRSEDLRRDLGRTRLEDRLYGPLINVQPFDVAPKFAGLDCDMHILSAGPVDDLNISYRGDGVSKMTLEIDANPSLYEMPELDLHLKRLGVFLGRALKAARLQDVPTLTDEEHQHLVFAQNATDHDVPNVSLAALIEAQMTRTPDATAVRFEGQTLSYTELDRKSRALAEQLVSLGAKKDMIVAVALERSLELAVAVVAIQRAGAAYAPLDPQQPPERLKALVQQTQPVALLAEADLDCAGAMQALPPQDWRAYPQGLPLQAPSPDDLSYVLFTSGSTGTPKGVMIEHKAIVNRLLWMRDHYGFGPKDVILQKTPTSFDVSIWELFLAYTCGASVVFAEPDAHRDPAAIARLIKSEHVSVCHFVPSMLSAFLDHPESEGLSLRQVFCSGEALSAAQRSDFHQRIHAELHNLYGPTEAAVDVTYWAASPEDDSAPLPIGHPVWNTRTYILDDALRPVPAGVRGQLYLGGVQLARGYMGREDLTTQSFIPDPFCPNERIYATGDLARYRTGGAIEYLGRNDHQVKIRGMRVELGEIEHALLALEAVKDAVVLARTEFGPQTQLVAYVQCHNALHTQDIQLRLRRDLPAHMIPSQIITLPSFPVTANGKLDRKALPAPQSTVASSQVDGDAPQTPLETLLAELYKTVLRCETQPSRDADFFDMGGDSLSAVSLQLELEQRLQQDISLGQIFESPRIQDLARALTDQDTARGGLSPLFPLHAGGAKDVPSFFLHPAGGMCWGYRPLAQSLARSLPEQFSGSMFGLQSPVLTGAEMPDSLGDLCKTYADIITAQTNAPKVNLLGWSLGGILAQELAVELTERGRSLGAVVLLDAYPAPTWRDEPKPDQIMALRALLAIAGHDPEAHPELNTRAKIVTFLKSHTSLLGALPRDVLDAVVRLVTGTNTLMRTHEHRVFNGEMIHIRAGHDHIGRGFTSDLWAPYCRALQTVDLPCLHKDMTSGQIAPLITEQLAVINQPQQS